MENFTPNLQQLNLYSQLVSKYLDADEIFKKELDENFVWFNGKPEVIEVFFKKYKSFL